MAYLHDQSVPLRDISQGSLLKQIIERIHQSSGLAETLEFTVLEIRSFLNLDRVKIYRFDEDGSGEVIAEAILDQHLPSLRGLHFPASDIPPQARELFMHARQRVIVDVTSQRKTLSSSHASRYRHATGEDTRYCPVDSCHLQYLTAMGVSASLTVPIVYQNQLWGLLVGHHAQPRAFSEQELQIVQLLVDQLPIAIAQADLLEQTQQQACQEAAIHHFNRLLTEASGASGLCQAALAYLVETLGAVGGRLYITADPIGHPSRIYIEGQQPTDVCVEESPIWQQLMGWQGVLAVSQRRPSEVVTTWDNATFVTRSESSDLPSKPFTSTVYCYTVADFVEDERFHPFAALLEAASIQSLLIIPLQYQHQYIGCLTLFRPEITTSTLWAGHWNRDERNSRPRASFDVWRELKTGQVDLWTSGEIKLAQVLGLHLYLAVMQQRVTELLHHHNSHDLLTGLPNRVLFEEMLALSLVNLHRNGNRLAVVFLDLDGFKAINDTLGHAVGDCVLQEVTARLQHGLSEGDVLARWGDDEFTLLVTISSAEDATRTAQALLKTLAQPFHIGNQDLHLTASIGIALAPYDGEDVDTLLHHAHATLSRVKQQGRNNYMLFAPTLNTMALKRLMLGNGLYKALERQELVLHYQPQVDIKTGKVVGMEALLRWQHPEMGLVFPAEFIELAEETGLICPIGEWVLRMACAQNRTWQALGLPPLKIAVNLSVRQFQKPRLAQTIARILQETQLAPQYLELEITESLLIPDRGEAIAVLQELQALGVVIAMDDFGTGYSCLSSLIHLPLNTLKIDRSFIEDLTERSSNAAIVSSIIALGRGLNLSVVAEGVETAEQLEFLRLVNCDTIQGYFISKPMDAGTATQFLTGKKNYHPATPALVQPDCLNAVLCPSNDDQRLAALYDYQILDTAPEATFDDVVCLTAQFYQVPVAWIGFIDRHRQWFKSAVGVETREIERSHSLCAYAILQNDVLLIPDTEFDERAANSWVTRQANLRFYAAAPLIDSNGFALGALCLAAYEPRSLDAEQRATLLRFARQVVVNLEARRNRLACHHLEDQLTRSRGGEMTHQKLEKTLTAYKNIRQTLVEQVNLARLAAQINAKLGDTGPIPRLLQECVHTLAQKTDFAFTGIWLLNPTTHVPELQASAASGGKRDRAVSTPGFISMFRVAEIAQTGQPYNTDQLLHDPTLADRDWVSQEGLTAFAGYPLVADNLVVGVLTVFAQKVLNRGTQEQLAAIAQGIARCIEHKQTEELFRQQAQRERLVTAIAQRIRQSLDLDEILNTTVREVRQFLRTDRVLIFRFKPDWSGTVVVESVGEEWNPIVCTVIDEPCFRDSYVPLYQQGRVRAIADIYTAGIAECHMNMLAERQVRANLVVPILHSDQLWGLLVAHHCSGPRQWRQLEISLLSQLATQAAIAIQQSELYHQVHKLATIDGLTQMANRRRFDEYLREKWNQMMRSETSLSLLLCDIDFFKVYNDTYGHPAGDVCLQQVAAAIAQAANRTEDLVARYGGEEFAVILPNTSMEGAMRVAERVQAAVRSLKLAHAQSKASPYVSISIGVASQIPTESDVLLDFITAADQALYHAKVQGRNQIASLPSV